MASIKNELKTSKKDCRNVRCQYCYNLPKKLNVSKLKLHILKFHSKIARKCLIWEEIFNKEAAFDTIYRHILRYHKNDRLRNMAIELCAAKAQKQLIVYDES